MAAITPFVEAADESQELEGGEGERAELDGLGTFAVERGDGGHDFYTTCQEALAAAGGRPVLDASTGRQVKRCRTKDPYLGDLAGLSPETKSWVEEKILDFVNGMYERYEKGESRTEPKLTATVIVEYVRQFALPADLREMWSAQDSKKYGGKSRDPQKLAIYGILERMRKKGVLGSSTGIGERGEARMYEPGSGKLDGVELGNFGAARGRKKSAEPTRDQLAFAVEEARQYSSRAIRAVKAENLEEAREHWKAAVKELRSVGLDWSELNEFDVPENLRHALTEVQQGLEAVHHVITGAETSEDVFGKLGGPRDSKRPIVDIDGNTIRPGDEVYVVASGRNAWSFTVTGHEWSGKDPGGVVRGVDSRGRSVSARMEEIRLAHRGALGDFGAVGVKNLVEQAHAGLTRFVWNRSLIEDHLRSCKFWIEDAPKVGLVIKIDKRLPRDTMPWKVMSPGARGDTFMLFSEGNSKMATLSWDLPAGPPGLGGTCPGAVAGQTILPPGARAAQLDASRTHLKILPPGATEPLPFHEERTICGFCYASEGNFGYTEIQAALIVRYWWTREALATAEGREAWIQTMVEGVLRSPFELQECQYSNTTSRPVRVHSSGDFFSPAYAEAWMEVANRVAERDDKFLFWAPTRTWASGFPWPKILAKNTARNFVVRPSAYHVGDHAPGPLAPGNAKGSTSLVMPPVAGKGPSNFQRLFPDALQDGMPGESSHDPRRDFDCPAYLGDAEGSCVSARCRVCWTLGDWSVNYPFH